MSEELMAPREKVLVEAKKKVKMNRSILEMLKDNTPAGWIAKLRDEWVEACEAIIKEKDAKGRTELLPRPTFASGPGPPERLPFVLWEEP